MTKIHKSHPVACTIFVSLLCSLSGCVVDEKYNYSNIKDNTDLEMTLFENGISMPLVESTANISVDSIMKATGIDTTSFGEYLKVSEDGSYYVNFEKQFSMADAIKDLSLEDKIKISGIDYSQEVSYEFGATDKVNFKTQASDYSESETIPDINLSISIDPFTKSCVLLSKEDVKKAASIAESLGETKVSFAGFEQYYSVSSADIPGFILPSQIKVIESATLKSGAGIKVKVSIPNAVFSEGDVIPNIHSDFSDILTFENGTGILDLKSLTLNESNNYTAESIFPVKSINLSKFTDNKSLEFTGKLKVTDLSATTQKAKTTTSDMSVELNISVVNFELESALGKVKDLSYNLDIAPVEFNYEVPSELADMGTVVITPKGSPAIEITLVTPEIEGISFTTSEGIVFYLPEFLKLNVNDPDITYNIANNTLLLNKIQNNTYNIPIKEIVSTPVKVGDKYFIKGVSSVSGSAGIDENTSIDIVKLASLSGKTISAKVYVPEIEAETVKVDKIGIDIDENASITLLKGSDIPEMISGIGEILLDNVKANLSLKLSDFPYIGEGKIQINLMANLPDFITPNQIAITGILSDDGSYNNTFDIEKLDFSKVDFNELRNTNGTLGSSIRIHGKITADNPTIAIKDLGTVHGQIGFNIGDASNQIKIKTINANVDYKIDSLIKVPFFSLPDALSKANLDLPNADVNVDITTNLSIQIEAALNIHEGLYDLPLKFPYADNPNKVLTEKNTFSIDLNKLIDAQLDTIDASFSVSVSPEKNTKIEMGSDYVLDMSLGINAPLQLGEEFYIEYADTVDISKNAETIADVIEASAIQLYGNVISTLPFNVKVKMEILCHDEESNTYTIVQTKEPVETILSKAGEENDFTLTFSAADGQDLSKLSHLKFSIELSANGSILAKDEYICIKGLGVTLPEGVTLDPTTLNKNNQ